MENQNLTFCKVSNTEVQYGYLMDSSHGISIVCAVSECSSELLAYQDQQSAFGFGFTLNVLHTSQEMSGQLCTVDAVTTRDSKSTDWSVVDASVVCHSSSDQFAQLICIYIEWFRKWSTKLKKVKCLWLVMWRTSFQQHVRNNFLRKIMYL